jgi:hypothetical protein
MSEFFSPPQIRDRAVVRYWQAEGVIHSEVHHRLVSVYCQIVFSLKEVSLRCNKFKDCRTALNVNPEKQESRSRSSHIDENCVTVEGFVRADLRTKTHCKNSCAILPIPGKGTPQRRNVYICETME